MNLSKDLSVDKELFSGVSTKENTENNFSYIYNSFLYNEFIKTKCR
jgi:hypothetical protein